jgi:outer membrane protein insertion porin family
MKRLLWGLCGVLFFTNTIWAQQEGDRLLLVDVEGADTIAKATILANVQTHAGMAYKEAIVSEDIRRIFALGYFTDVKADTRPVEGGLEVIFLVKEKPQVIDIHIEGNRRLRDKKILDLLEIKEGDLYDGRTLKAGIDRLSDEYKRKGFSNSKISSKLEEDSLENTVNIYLLIDEGPSLRIGRVLIEGNKAFSDRVIRRLVKSKKRWFVLPGIYNDEVLEEDLERVRAFYRKHGHQDVVVDHEVYRAPDGERLYVHLKIEEGIQYRVGTIALQGMVVFPEQEARSLIKLKPGAVYNTEMLQEDLRAIKQYYGDRGYIHAQVVPGPEFDKESHRVNLTYQITEDTVYYVGRLQVEGNVRTKDEVVRREFKLYPGERFDGAKIRKSIDRLYNLGYFEEVNVDTRSTTIPQHEDLVVEVKEAKTGSFSFGGGFSSIDRLVGMIELEQRNFDIANWPTFTGAGQDLLLRVEMGSIRRYFDLSFTDPWIMGYPVSFGFDLYNRTRLRSEDVGLAFEEERRGFGLRLGKEWFDFFSTGIGYSFYRTDISDVVADASADLKAEEGVNDISSVRFSAGYDRRDNRLDPYDGYYLFSSLDVAGGPFAGDKDFARLQGGASYYWEQNEALVFEARVRTGIVETYGDSAEVPIFERFFGGGSGTIRGYRERHVGPRDVVSSDPIGGEAMFSGTLEEVLTIVRDERDRPILRGSVFYDVGDVWRRVSEYGSSLKSGVGVGARVKTPIGPLNLDLGYPLDELAGEDQKLRFHFNVSRSF